MELKLDKKWQISLSPRDIALVIRALLGRLQPADKDAAKLLADDITKARSAQARQFANEMEVHAEKAREDE